MGGFNFVGVLWERPWPRLVVGWISEMHPPLFCIAIAMIDFDAGLGPLAEVLLFWQKYHGRQLLHALLYHRHPCRRHAPPTCPSHKKPCEGFPTLLTNIGAPGN